MTRRDRKPIRVSGPGSRTIAVVVPAALALAVAVGLAACGSDEATTLDAAATEDAVAEVVAEGLEVEVDDVTCPDDIERSAGTTVRCRATLADEVGDVRIEVRQADDEGTLDVEVLDAVIDRAAVVDQLVDQLTATYERDFTIDCGDGGLEVVAPDSSFLCAAADADGARDVTVTVTDAAGTLRFEVADGPAVDGPPEDDAQPMSPGPGG